MKERGLERERRVESGSVASEKQTEITSLSVLNQPFSLRGVKHDNPERRAERCVDGCDLVGRQDYTIMRENAHAACGVNCIRVKAWV